MSEVGRRMKVFATIPCHKTGVRAVARCFPALPGLLLLALLPAARAFAQAAHGDEPNSPDPIAIVPIEASNQDQAKVTGALQITKGTASILKNGTISSGTQMTSAILPHRGVLRICPSTALTLSADTSVPGGETPGLMMAMDHGALEASFAAGRNADVLITPDLRIVIGGPGSVDLKVRLGQQGDTCVDNAGANPPYVVVSSVFEEGVYRVQPGQRVMFQHGSLREVVDQEKEPCGCPASARPGTNDFPQDQSAGLAPLQVHHPAPVPPANTDRASAPPELSQGLSYPHNAPATVPAPAKEPEPSASLSAPQATVTQPAPAPTAPPKKGFFKSLGRFFKRVFGAD